MELMEFMEFSTESTLSWWCTLMCLYILPRWATISLFVTILAKVPVLNGQIWHLNPEVVCNIKEMIHLDSVHRMSDLTKIFNNRTLNWDLFPMYFWARNSIPGSNRGSGASRGWKIRDFRFFSPFTVICMTESPRKSLSDQAENFCACSHNVWL